MTYALNEIETLVRKAALGAGLDPGRADELAVAGLWLARRRFPVCDIVHTALASGCGAPLAVAPDDTAAECAAARAARTGPAVFDLLLAKPTGFRAALRDLDEPRLIIAMAAVTAIRHGEQFLLQWEDALLPIGPESNPALTSVSAGPVRLLTVERATRAAGLRATATAGSQARATRYDPAAVGDGGWAALDALARLTHVPASEQSRRTGAGAGLTDND